MGWLFGGWPPPPPALDTVTFAEVKAALAMADSSVSFNGQKIVDLAAGTDPTDAVNLGQLGGIGFVVGPGSSTDKAVARFDLATGKVIQNSVVTIGDTGAVAGASSYNALPINATADLIAMGIGALHLGVGTGTSNVAIGHGTLANVTTATSNIAIGLVEPAFPFPAPGAAMTTGFGNVLIGIGAGGSLTTATGCVAIGGSGTLSSMVTGGASVAVGSSAMRNATAPGTAIGSSALRSMTAGTLNTAVGLTAAQFLTTGSRNTYLGANAAGGGSGNVTGDDNVGVGNDALRDGNAGSRNTAVGSVARGGGGSDNVSLGYHSLTGITTTAGSRNTALGSGTGASLSTGNDNVVIGYIAGATLLGTESGNILIGSGVDLPLDGADSQLNIGGLVFGDMAGVKVRIGGSGSLAAQTAKLRVLNAGADMVPVLALASTGANGAEIAIRAGTQVPAGTVSGNAGDLYVRKAGAASGVYVNQSAADPGTTWTLLL